jgi:uncharacterized membrane protein
MKRISTLLVLLFAASTCFAQMYTVTDLGVGTGSSSEAVGINSSGQVAGTFYVGPDRHPHAFRTAANSAIKLRMT